VTPWVAFIIGALVAASLMFAVMDRAREGNREPNLLRSKRRGSSGSDATGPLPLPPRRSSADGPPPPRGRHGIEVISPKNLPTFVDVGGMDALKQEMRDTVGLVLAHADKAEEYRINWNGLLLHGPPGVGKSFFARALAGELGLNLVLLSTADLVTPMAGDGPGRVVAAFDTALAHLPCVLFFDELDAVAESRTDDASEGSAHDVLAQLLQSLEQHRDEPRLVVAAATNDLDSLDAAVIRAGRFDRHVRVDLPDQDARKAIIATRLTGRPVQKDLDLDEVARRTKGRTPAAIALACEGAALAAFRQAIGTGKVVRISNAHLCEAVDHGGGEDRPLVESWSWDRLILDPSTLAELRELQSLIEDPQQSESMGVEPPTGVLLVGAPGTGKTTIAKVLAAEAACSFYPVSAADITSRWVGESERAIARLFRRARANAPSIVFIDELDAVGSARGQLGTYDRQLDQLLQEIDGMSGTGGVLVIGATNRPNAIDPALRRGGRLSRTIEIPLPDADGRLALLSLLSQRMPLEGVDLEEIALETEGFSGADLKALCQQAALEALVRQRQARAAGRLRERVGSRPHVKPADFHRALTVNHHEPDAPTRRRHR
jgi:transitional endoplasmic reticulum ATPase